MTDNLLTAQSVDKHYNELAQPGTFLPNINSTKASATYVSQRPEFNKNDLYSARPSLSIATDINKIMEQCELIYWRTGILRSIIEFISEFIVDGLDIVHEDEDIQNFYRTWMRKTQLVSCAEQFCRHLYRSGNVVLRRYVSDITVPIRNKMMDRVLLSNNVNPKPKKGAIPVKYVFYRPSAIKLVGDELGAWSDEKIYGLQIPSKELSRLMSPRTELERKVWNSLPKDVQESVRKNTGSYITYPLPSNQIYVAHYKKDDADIWAYPLIYAALDTLNFNQNLLTAKSVALEGWYNLIRLWKLGDHNAGILPPKSAAAKLNSILDNNTGGGKIDLIWDSMIELQEFYPPVEKLASLQEDKNAVLILFGIPEELAGGVSEKSSGNNSSVRLKNFAKKLDAGRREVKNWIMNEIDIVHQNMGFASKPYLRFNNDDLIDERVYYELLRELSDRNFISSDTILERLDEIPELEKKRIQKQQKMIDDGDLPPRASPFHNPNLELQSELDKSKITHQNKFNEVNKKPNENLKDGRPFGSKDTNPRKRSNNKISKAFALSYGTQLLDFINNKVNELYLQKYNINDYRQLTNEQKTLLDGLKTSILASTEPGSTINMDILSKNPDRDLYSTFMDIFIKSIKELPFDKISNKEKDVLKLSSYAELWANTD